MKWGDSMRGFLTTLALALLPGAALGGTLDKIAETGTITLGIRTDSAPFSFLDGSGKAAGYSVQLCEAVVRQLASELGRDEIEIVYQATNPDTRFPLLIEDKIDLECGSTTYALERTALVDFSLLTFATGAGLLLEQDSGIAGLPDLGGKRVGVRGGANSEALLRQLLAASGIVAEVVPLPSYDDLIASLETGEVDAAFGDRALLLGARTHALDAKGLVLADARYSYEPYALPLRRDDAAFRQAVDRALARLYRSDEIVRIYETWFGDLSANPETAQVYRLLALPE